jgi:hypothetical protein
VQVSRLALSLLKRGRGEKNVGGRGRGQRCTAVCVPLASLLCWGPLPPLTPAHTPQGMCAGVWRLCCVLLCRGLLFAGLWLTTRTLACVPPRPRPPSSLSLFLWPAAPFRSTTSSAATEAPLAPWARSRVASSPLVLSSASTPVAPSRATRRWVQHTQSSPTLPSGGVPVGNRVANLAGRGGLCVFFPLCLRCRA